MAKADTAFDIRASMIRGLVFWGALLVVTGAATLIVRVAGGEWPPIGGDALSANDRSVLVVVLLVVGLGLLGLAGPLRRGSAVAGGVMAFLSTALFITVVCFSIARGPLWYELLLSATFAVDAGLLFGATLLGSTDGRQ